MSLTQNLPNAVVGPASPRRLARLDKIIATGLLALVAANAGGYPEAATVLAAGGLVALGGPWVVTRLGRLTLPLLTLLALAVVMTAVSGTFNYDAARAVYMILRVPVWLGLGVAIMVRFRDVTVPLNAVMIAALGLSLYFFFLYISNPDIVAQGRYALRVELSGGWLLLPFGILSALYAILTRPRMSLPNFAFLGGVISFAVLAMLLSQSRTSLLAALLGGACMLGLIPPRLYPRLIVPCIFVVFLIFTTPILTYVMPVDAIGLIDVAAPDAVREMLALYRTDRGEMNDFWRGHEAFTVFSFMEARGPWAMLFGTGLDSRVPLATLHQLGDRAFGDIPVFHSLYSFVLVRAGATGLVLTTILYVALAEPLSRLASAPERHLRLLGRFGTGAHLSALISVPTTAGVLNGGEGGSSHLLVIGVVIGCSWLATNPIRATRR